MNRTTAFSRLQIRPGADRIVAHVGARVLGDLADRVVLVAGLSAALAPLKQRRRGHDRGHVVTQLASAIADGATTLSDLAVLRLSRICLARWLRRPPSGGRWPP